MTESVTDNSSGMLALAGRWHGFVAWWLGELRQAIPSKWKNWSTGEVAPVLWIKREDDIVICEINSATIASQRRFPLALFGARTIQAWLEECGLCRDQVMIGSVIDRELFFQRQLTIPKAAFGALSTILDQEVLRRTPFELAEIFQGATPDQADDATSGLIGMTHWIVGKNRVASAMAEIGLTAQEVDFLSAADEPSTPLISFRTLEHQDPPWAWRAVRLLGMAAIGAVLVGLLAFEWRQSHLANHLEIALEQARGSVKSRSGPGNQASGLFALKASVSVIEIWDELSRVLPEHSFLSELRIVDGKVTILGYSSDAARLVRLIDHSNLFSGATLVSAITPDANERKDRFSLTFRVRGGHTSSVQTNTLDRARDSGS